MVVTPILVAIATRDRPELLERTLKSLAQCELPEGFLGAVVAENGGGASCERIVERVDAPFPIRYLKVSEPGKNRSLNEIVSEYPDAFVVFSDDDVRYAPQALLAYASACDRAGRGTFFGGQCRVDYEEKPPAWMAKYLPDSAKGWGYGSEPCPIQSAMGFNWGAFSRDIINAGWFLMNLGPGTWHSIGDETEMQSRLIQFGGKGEYLPDALVWHYVPRDRCDEAWVVKRAYQHGIARGLQLVAWPEAERRRFASSCRTKAHALRLALGVLTPMLSDRLRCHCRWARQWKLGVLCGLNMLTEHERTPLSR